VRQLDFGGSSGGDQRCRKGGGKSKGKNAVFIKPGGGILQTATRWKKGGQTGNLQELLNGLA